MQPDTLSGATGEAQGGEQDQGVASETTGNGDERQLLASLRKLVDRDGPVRTAEALGVNYRTVTRAIETNTLTGRMEDALKSRDGEAGGGAGKAPSRRLEALERRQERLETALAALATELGAQLASISVELGSLPGVGSDGERKDGAAGSVERRNEATGEGTARAPAPVVRGVTEPVIGREPATKPTKPWRPWPDVVTLAPEEGEELVYGDATPLIVEWRQAQADGRDEHRSRVERATAWVRAYELELALIGERGLTLPPAAHPWDRFDRRRQLHRREQYLRAARRERQRALCWRFLRRVLTLGSRRR